MISLTKVFGIKNADLGSTINFSDLQKARSYWSNQKWQEKPQLRAVRKPIIRKGHKNSNYGQLRKVKKNLLREESVENPKGRKIYYGQ